jgi:preprotein translocase SecF subunit
MTFGAVAGPKVKLDFSEETSPNYVRGLLERSFRLKGALDDTGGTSFDLTDDKGEPLVSGARLKTMVLDVSKNPKFNALVAQTQSASERTALKAALAAASPILGGIAFATADAEAPAAATTPEATTEAKTLDDILKQTKETFDSRPIPERLETFDSQLAAETRSKAFIAIVISWIAIILYLWFRFGNWTFGTAAVLCLIHDLCFTLGAITACHYLAGLPGAHFLGIEDFKIDLAAVAALLTLVGYSVNEIIVNFARIREVRGKSPELTPQMINDSVNQTLSRTMLTSTTVFLVSIVLYAFGGEGIHLFAFVMVMGVMISTYSSIFVASPLLLMFGEGHASKSIVSKRKEEAKV